MKKIMSDSCIHQFRKENKSFINFCTRFSIYIKYVLCAYIIYIIDCINEFVCGIIGTRTNKSIVSCTASFQEEQCRNC